MSHFRPLIFVASMLGGVAAWGQDAARFDAPTAAFLKQHCLRCHGPEKAEGELRLDKLGTDLAQRDVFERWHLLVKRITAGEMPPEGEPQPAAAERTAAARALSAQLAKAAESQRAAGRVVLRRLNRVEYENTVRDLFAVDVAVKEILPEDTISRGFDNIGEALNISPVLMERYLEAADAVLTAAATPVAPAESKRETFLLAESIPAWFTAVLPKGDSVVLFRSEGSATHLGKFRPHATGRYRVRVPCFAYQSETPLAMSVLAGNFFGGNGLGSWQVGYFDAPPGEPKVVEFEVRLQARVHTIKLMPAFLPRTYVKQETLAEYPGPGLGIGPIEIEGPLPEQIPSEAYRRLFGEADPKKGTLADAERTLRELLPKAFRRPTTDADLAPYLALVSKSLTAGEPYELALRGGIKAILCSPRFLYLREEPGELDDYALAARLSYCFWSTLPDDVLLELAAKGELKQPAELREQVERLLADPRAEQFTRNFVGQWLSLRDIEATTPDKQLYPEFEELLQWSMVRETEAFFNELLHHDLPVQNFVESDFAMLNGRLAKHYGIAGVEGVGFRRVALKPEDHRGGVLTHASVLKVTANGTTTSPVVRGVWVLDRIMGQPVPPPPANVPAIEPDIRGAVTIREQLARHRDTPNCSSCHVKIDPPGFALENYDVIGGWREQYRAIGVKNTVRPPESPLTKFLARPQYGLGLPVEAGSALADGRKFADLREFKQLLLADPDQIVRCVAEKLATYATGHPIDYADRAELARIVAASREGNHGLRNLVHLVVGSELFRHK